MTNSADGIAAPDDPPVGACPSWCEKPVGHDWEDLWLNGLIRYHTMTRNVTDPPYSHSIGIEEIEQHTATGTVRERLIVLDVEAPTSWELATAERGAQILAEVMAIARTDAPTGKVR